MRKRKSPKTNKKHYALGIFDSPVIYGVRVETSNPYHLLYIEKVLNLQVKSNPKYDKCQVFDLDELYILEQQNLCISNKRRDRSGLSHVFPIQQKRMLQSSPISAIRARDSIRMP